MTASPVHKTLAGLIIISCLLSLCACEVQYEPDIHPSGLGTVEPEQPFDEVTETDTLVSIDPIEDLNSKEAVEICTEILTWGDTDRGGCRKPGGSHYYLWIDPTVVIQVEIDASDSNQSAFLLASDSRTASIDDFHDNVGIAIIGVIGFGLEIPAALALCSSGLGCILGGAALSVTGYGLSVVGDSITENIESFTKADTQTDFFYCQIQGNSEETCRDVLNISSSDLGETDD